MAPLALGFVVDFSSGEETLSGSEGPVDLSNVRFHPLAVGRNLPLSAVNAVLVDGKGALWLGTDSGLWQVQNAGFRQFASDGVDGSVSLNGKRVTALAEGLPGHLWIGTADMGLCRYDSMEKRVRRVFTQGQLPGSEIVSLLWDLRGNLWIGTDAGLAMLPSGGGEVTVFGEETGGARVAALGMEIGGTVWAGCFDGRLFSCGRGEERPVECWRSSTPIAAVTSDPGDGLWIGTQGGGLFRLPAEAAREKIPPVAESISGLTSRMVVALFQDEFGHLWISTPEGLTRVDRGRGLVANYRHEPGNAASLPAGKISAICSDRLRGVWVASESGSIARVDLKDFGFPHHRVDESAAQARPGRSIWDFAEERDGFVWVATESGLRRWHPDQGWVGNGNILTQPGSVEPFVQVVHVDAKGRLWMGTRGDGLYLRDEAGAITRMVRHPAQAAGLPNDAVSALHVDAKGRLWVGTMGGGVARWMESGGQTGFLAALTEAPPAESEVGAAPCRHVTSMAQDGTGRTWVGSWEGLFLLDGDLAKLRHYRNLDLSVSEPLSSDSVSCVFGDSRGYLWIGTTNDGLNRFEPSIGRVKHFHRGNCGLPDDRIGSIEEDAQGRLWISTGAGIGLFDSETEKVRRFGAADGLQNGQFHCGASLRLKSGRLVFGGTDGFNSIDPENLPPLRGTRKPVLAGLELSGAPVIPGAHPLLDRPLAETEEIRIPFDSGNRFSFRLASGDLAASGPEYYRFRMKGQDLSWNVAGADKEAVYTGLAPGKYLLEVQSSADGRDWNEEATALGVNVLPPWHRTWWAYTLYVLSGCLCCWLAATVFGYTRHRHQRLMIERAEQQRDRAEAELARQWQHSLLLDQAGRELGQDRDARDLFGSALRIVARQFCASRCSILACPGESGKGESDSRLVLLADYRGEEAPNTLPELRSVDEDLDAALREVLLGAEMAIVPKDVASRGSVALKLIADRWLPGGGFILRRTSFLDQFNGAILLRRSGQADGLASSDLQMLEALSKQLGIAIAQWRVAQQDRQRVEALEFARQAAESANRAKSDFLAKMTHELRTPLNAILGFSEVMNEDSELNDRQREVMAIINNSGEHLHEVINGVLDLAKIEAGKIEIHPARFELERMLRSLHKMLSLRARSQGLEFPFELVTALPRMIETDKGKLRQILINLLGNAIKFTETGRVTLSAWAEVTGDTVTDQGVRRRPIRLSFEVRDTGPGIPPGDLHRLFDQYAQAEAGRSAADSTGLGLTIAKAFAELLGGGITVQSEVGSGTSFRLHIACEEISIVAAATEPADGTRASLPGGFASPAGRSGGMIRRIAPGQGEVRVLIAEDQLPNRLLLRKHLGPAGFQLREAEDGQAAVEMWRKWRPHLILMDEQMPIMTGREATRAIMSEAETGGDGGADHPVPVIVALTAFALDQSRSAAIEAGCSDFLAKPFRRDELFGMLTRNLPHLQFEGDGDSGGTASTPPGSVALAG